jgi:ribose transport system permease protein
MSARRPLKAALLDRAPLLLFAAVLLTFGLLSPRFFAAANFLNIVVHASSLGIVAVGMTFVLLTAGIDLSAGAAMFLAGIAAGKVILAGGGVLPALGASLVAALLWGALNALFVVRLRIAAFVVTLATLYAGRGLGLMITETRAMNLPEEIRALGAARVLGVPFPVIAFVLVVALAHLVLTRTAFGRQVYAVGADAEGAKRAGLRVPAILASVYVISAVCAGLGGFVAVAQIGAVSPSFGQQRELAAIAAAVLGGTSLFGGRGQVLPGTVIGALLMQTVETGLVILNVDPYLYPLITAGIIFVAVAIDSLRNVELAKRSLRRIRPVG